MIEIAAPRNHRILLIDDNRAIHEDFRKILINTTDRTLLDAAAAGLFGNTRKTHYAPTFLIDSAYQGQEGAEMTSRAVAANDPYAVAFVDMRMPPGWDGVKTITRLWEIEPDLQIVLCTAHSDYSLDQIQEKTAAADRLLILKKPFDTVEVRQLAYALTEKWRLQQISRTKTAELEKMVEIRTRDLLAANEHLQTQSQLIDLAHDAIVVQDMEDRVRFWNTGAEKLYGWARTEVEGRIMTRLIFHDTELYTDARRQLLEKGEWQGQCLHLTQDEREITVNSRWTLLRDQAGEPKSVLIISTDITERKQLEDQFFRTQRLESIGTLASGLAHDLNNVLAPILMCVPLLRRSLPPEQKEEIIGTIKASASRGAQIVRQVLTFGRGEEGERKPVQMKEVIEEIIQLAKETFPKNIRIERVIEPGLAEILGDMTQWHQVLLNLCVNARDAMPEGGVLRISAANLYADSYYASMTPGIQEGPHIAVEVTDTGGGIPPQIAHRIFDPFFTTKPLGTGTGLGLSTSLGIIKSHSAAIHLDTEPGKGTTFRIIIPACTDFMEPAEEAVDIALPYGNGEIILVTDDEENVRNIARTVLDLHGYNIMMAADGTEALAIYAQFSDKLDLILTDITMPYVDGVTFIRALQSMQCRLPIIATSGAGDATRIAELKALGIETILEKPYSAEVLLYTISNTLKAARAEAGQALA